ncbi:MAG: ATP-binding protein, partial [Anaeromyxobacteraceae bacterium]
ALLAAIVVTGGRRIGLGLRAEACTRARLELEVAERTASLEKQREELAARVGQLAAARAHLGVTDRLAAVGRLASGVAHEVNNPLAVTLTNLSWALESLRAARAGLAAPPAEEIEGALAEAEGAAQRVAAIVRDLQDFARDRPRDAGIADVVQVVQNVIRLVGHEVRARGRLVVDLPDAPALVAGTSARVGQLVAHLAMHAAVSIAENQPDANEVRLSVRADGERVTVEVRDTGRGLDADQLAHVFDPFYAAWSTGEAHGLGLAVCHGLAGALGGEITAESAPGRGSVYRVSLPVATSAARLVLGGARRAAARARVLVVDDEPLVVASVYRLLSRRFDVVPHTSARHALGLIRAGEHFDAVLCDVMMPELSGAAFHEALRQVNPALAAATIFLTGGAFTTAAHAFLERVPNPRVTKPFDAAELVAAIEAQCTRRAA